MLMKRLALTAMKRTFDRVTKYFIANSSLRNSVLSTWTQMMRWRWWRWRRCILRRVRPTDDAQNKELTRLSEDFISDLCFVQA